MRSQPLSNDREELSIERLDPARRRGRRAALLEQEPRLARAFGDPAKVMSHHASDPALGAGSAGEHLAEATLVVAQAFDVQIRGDPLLVTEVVVDRTDRGAGARPDVGDRRRCVALLGEGIEGGLADRGRAGCGDGGRNRIEF
jgi:hypothetical protein